MTGVRFVALNLTGRCNLSCAYCYAQAGPTGPDMTPRTAWQALENLAPEQGPLTVEMAGGEPLLNYELVQELARDHDRDRVRLAIQTNGLLLDRDKVDFLARHRVGLGLSLDGPPEINDRLRGRAGEVFQALEVTGRAGLGVNITVVLTRHNLSALPQFLLLLARQPAVRVINLDLVRTLGRAASDLAPDPAEIRDTVPRLLDVLAFVNARRWPPLKVREVEQTLRRAGEEDGKPYCLAGRGGYAAVTPTGEIYACSSLTGRARFQAGNASAPDPGGLWSLARAAPPPRRCRDCPAGRACRGGCPARRWAEGGPGAVSESECALRMALWERLAA